MELQEAIRIIVQADERTVEELPDGLIKDEVKRLRGMARDG